MKDANKKFNIMIIILVVLNLIGLYFLYNLKLDSGGAYLMLSLISLIFLIIVFIAKYVFKISFWFENPIDNGEDRAVLMFFFGIIMLLVITVFTSLFQFSFYDPLYFKPFSSFNQINAGLSFNALQTVTSSIGTFFIVGIVAPITEEIALGWAFMLMGSLVLGYGLRKILKLELGKTGDMVWDFIFAMAFSMILFSVFHIFNGSYLNADGSMNTRLFFIAGTFRVVMNILMYTLGNFGIMFGIGFHSASNSVLLGLPLVFAAFISFPVGIIIFIILLLMFVYAIMNIPKIFSEGRLVIKDFWTID